MQMMNKTYLNTSLKLAAVAVMALSPSLYASHSPIVFGVPHEDSCGTGVGGEIRNENTNFTAVCNYKEGPENSAMPNSGAVILSWSNTGDGGVTAGQNNVIVKAPNTDSEDKFGSSVILSGNKQVLLVGAPGEDSCTKFAWNDTKPFDHKCTDESIFKNPMQDSGAVYAYAGTGDFGNSNFITPDAGNSLYSQSLIEQSSRADVIKAFNGNDWDNFGAEIHISADAEVMVVGAPGEDSCAVGPGSSSDGSNRVNPNKYTGGNYLCPQDHELSNSPWNNNASQSGAVYIYRRASGDNPQRGWVFETYLKAPNSDKGDLFGSALGLSSDGKQLLVGAPGESNCGTGVGGAGENPNVKLGQNFRCNNTSSLYGKGYWNNEAEDSGAVYHYKYQNGQWELANYIKPSNTDTDDQFGSSLSFGNNNQMIIVGAPGEDSCAASDARNPKTLVANPNARLGRNHVCGTNPEITQTSNDLGGSGAVYIFDKDYTGSYRQTAYIKATNPDSGDMFGASLFVSPNNGLQVGAPGEDGCGTGVGGTGINTVIRSGKPVCSGTGETNNNAKDSGAMYYYSIRSNSEVKNALYIKAPEVQPSDAFGTSISATSINPTLESNEVFKGVSIIAVGSPGFDVIGSSKTIEDAGRVFLFGSVENQIDQPVIAPAQAIHTGYIEPIKNNYAVHYLMRNSGLAKSYTNTLSDFDYQGGASMGGGGSIADQVGSDCDLFDLFAGSSLGDVADFLQCVGKFGVN